MTFQLTGTVFCLLSLFITGYISLDVTPLQLESSLDAFNAATDKSNRELGIIAGGVSGGLALLVLIFVLVACCIKANKHTRRATGAVVHPAQPSIAVTNTSVSTSQPQYPMQPPPSYTGYPAKPSVNQGYPPPAQPAFYPPIVASASQPNPV